MLTEQQMYSRIKGVYDRLQVLSDALERVLQQNAISPRRVANAEVQQMIERLIGARMVLVFDGATEHLIPAWEASTRALDKAKLYGFTWS